MKSVSEAVCVRRFLRVCERTPSKEDKSLVTSAPPQHGCPRNAAPSRKQESTSDDLSSEHSVSSRLYLVTNVILPL